MVGGPRQAKILRELLRAREREEEGEKHMLFGLLHGDLRPLLAVSPRPPACADTAIRLP